MIAKFLLATFTLLLLGGSIYFFFIHQPKTAVFERDNTLLEHEESALPTPSLKEEPTSSFIEILPEDCTRECSTFQSSPDQYIYCRSVCGLPLTTPENSSPLQSTNTSLEKDLQQKDTAIKESDLSKCEAIKDTQLKKGCQVRVTEDLLE